MGMSRSQAAIDWDGKRASFFALRENQKSLGMVIRPFLVERVPTRLV
jgi:hypothetical protein